MENKTTFVTESVDKIATQIPQIPAGNNKLTTSPRSTWCQCLCGRRERHTVRCLMGLKNETVHRYSRRSKTNQFENSEQNWKGFCSPSSGWLQITAKSEKDWSSLGHMNCQNQTIRIPFQQRASHWGDTSWNEIKVQQ